MLNPAYLWLTDANGSPITVVLSLQGVFALLN